MIHFISSTPHLFPAIRYFKANSTLHASLNILEYLFPGYLVTRSGACPTLCLLTNPPELQRGSFNSVSLMAPEAVSCLNWVLRALDPFTHLSGDVAVTLSGCHNVCLSCCQAVSRDSLYQLSSVRLGLPYVTPDAF